ncbi:MAG: EamA family transporter, partial [Desulfamplus sp.]|nr:EamA family transporter [Desulfamplus sp.]
MSAVLTALVPIGYAAIDQGLPSLTQFSGFVFVMVAVWLLSSAGAGFGMTWEEFRLSTMAGLGFGFFFIFIHLSNQVAVIWPLVGARAASVSLLLLLGLLSLRGGKGSMVPVEGQWKFIFFTGVLDALGNAFFSMAAHLGRLDVSAVLGSLYPAATVMLAWFFLKERLRKQQWAGVGAAFVALVLISV